MKILHCCAASKKRSVHECTSHVKVCLKKRQKCIHFVIQRTGSLQNRVLFAANCVDAERFVSRNTLGLARWPAHLPSSKHVQVQMIDGLSRLCAGIDHNSEIAVPLLPSHARSRFEKVGDRFAGCRIQELTQIRRVFHGHDQKMARRLRADVLDDGDIVVSMNEFSGNFAGDNPAENTIRRVHGLTSECKRSNFGLRCSRPHPKRSP